MSETVSPVLEKIVNSKKNSLLFFDFQYGFLRSGTNEISNALNSSIRFTIVIRTFQRPQLLARTLESLRWQVYTNFDVIVVEDGKNPVSMKIVESAAQWLNICYVCARTQWGRCRTGNEGVIRAQTEYVCFLDDDDYFLQTTWKQWHVLLAEHQNVECFAHKQSKEGVG